MENVLTDIQTTLPLIGQVLGYIVMAALVASRVTKNEVHNKYARKAMKFINALGVNLKGMDELLEYEKKQTKEE